MRIMVYDAEIENAIPTKDEAPLPGINYCKSWSDHAGMGVSVICAYLLDEGPRVFLKDNFSAFKALAEAPDVLCVGYNSHSFDDLLMARALGIHIAPGRSWDLLRAVRVARGQSPGAPGGPSLHNLCQANFLPGKSGSGAFAPILWQKGKLGQVVDYALNDVMQTYALLELVRVGRLRDADSGRILNVIWPTFDTLRAAPAAVEVL
jgi:hypothetical protein